MTQGHHALTDKEKQALRLLTSGYDAKSMASHLGLSVHTVNERLRDARRKMATSSSREAARLLRDLEGPPPEKAADKDLGDAADAVAAADSSGQPSTGSTRRHSGWIIGGITMSLALVAIALASLSAPNAAAPAAAPTAPAAATAETAPVAVARQFLALIDADDWATGWTKLGASMKAQNTEKSWTDASNGMRANLGAFVRREQASADYVPAPPAGYWMIKFRASYAKKPIAIETVTLMKEADGWHVVGVTID
jgi:DNA-binding CsgD family transcriptional regulator